MLAFSHQPSSSSVINNHPPSPLGLSPSYTCIRYVLFSLFLIKNKACLPSSYYILLLQRVEYDFCLFYLQGQFFFGKFWAMLNNIAVLLSLASGSTCSQSLLSSKAKSPLLSTNQNCHFKKKIGFCQFGSILIFFHFAIDQCLHSKLSLDLDPAMDVQQS